MLLNKVGRRAGCRGRGRRACGWRTSAGAGRCVHRLGPGCSCSRRVVHAGRSAGRSELEAALPAAALPRGWRRCTEVPRRARPARGPLTQARPPRLPALMRARRTTRRAPPPWTRSSTRSCRVRARRSAGAASAWASAWCSASRWAGLGAAGGAVAGAGWDACAAAAASCPSLHCPAPHLQRCCPRGSLAKRPHPAAPPAGPNPLPLHPQRYSQGSLFKRSVLDMIAEELLRQSRADEERGCPIGTGGRPVITDPQVGAAGGDGRSRALAWPAAGPPAAPHTARPRLPRQTRRPLGAALLPTRPLAQACMERHLPAWLLVRQPPLPAPPSPGLRHGVPVRAPVHDRQGAGGPRGGGRRPGAAG